MYFTVRQTDRHIYPKQVYWIRTCMEIFFYFFNVFSPSPLLVSENDARAVTKNQMKWYVPIYNLEVIGSH